jgi:hypothetical protein
MQSNPVRQESFYANPVAGAYWYCFIVKAFSPLCLATTKVALADLNPHYFAASGNMEAALRPFVCLNFWHPTLTPHLPLFCFFAPLSVTIS